MIEHTFDGFDLDTIEDDIIDILSGSEGDARTDDERRAVPGEPGIVVWMVREQTRLSGIRQDWRAMPD